MYDDGPCRTQLAVFFFFFAVSIVRKTTIQLKDNISQKCDLWLNGILSPAALWLPVAWPAALWQAINLSLFSLSLFPWLPSKIFGSVGKMRCHSMNTAAPYSLGCLIPANQTDMECVRVCPRAAHSKLNNHKDPPTHLSRHSCALLKISWEENAASSKDKLLTCQHAPVHPSAYIWVYTVRVVFHVHAQYLKLEKKNLNTEIKLPIAINIMY